MRVLFSLQLKEFLTMSMSAEPGGKVPYSTDLRWKLAGVRSEMKSAVLGTDKSRVEKRLKGTFVTSLPS